MDSRCVTRPGTRRVPLPGEVLLTITSTVRSGKACGAVVGQQNLRHKPLDSLGQVQPVVSVRLNREYTRAPHGNLYPVEGVALLRSALPRLEAVVGTLLGAAF